MVVIWPLRQKLLQPVFMQQRPRWTGGRRIPSRPTLPWRFKDRPQNGQTSFNRIDRAPMAVDSLASRSAFPRPVVTRPAVVHALRPMPAPYYSIAGTTKDKTGAALGSCVVHLTKTASDMPVDQITSDASGNFEFRSASPAQAFYSVAYKAGSPDLTGATKNNLVAGDSVSIFLRDPTVPDGPGGSAAYRVVGSPVVRRVSL
jgi:hypothetical protein